LILIIGYGENISGHKETITIIVDDREVRSGVLGVIEKMDGVTAVVKRMPLGDYAIDGRLLVERKTIRDLVISIKDERLFGQACRLADSPLWTAIILEGTGRDLAASGMRREAIQGALITLTLYLGIPLLRSRDLHETIRLLLYAARQGRAVASGALPRKGRRYKGKRRVQAHILQGLPGVGPERAKQLLEQFGSVEAVVAAKEEELTAVQGIGQGTAQAIRWSVEETQTLYGNGDGWNDPVL